MPSPFFFFFGDVTMMKIGAHSVLFVYIASLQSTPNTIMQRILLTTQRRATAASVASTASRPSSSTIVNNNNNTTRSFSSAAAAVEETDDNDGRFSIQGTFREGRASYLDMSATTPMDPRVLDKMMPFMVSDVHKHNIIFM